MQEASVPPTEPSCSMRGASVPTMEPSYSMQGASVPATEPSCSMRGASAPPTEPSCSVQEASVPTTEPSCSVQGALKVKRPPFQTASFFVLGWPGHLIRLQRHTTGRTVLSFLLHKVQRRGIGSQGQTQCPE